MILAVAAIACANASLVSPFIAPAPIVTARSSQVFARNYNGIVAPVLPAPLPLIPAAPPVGFAPQLLAPRFAAPFAFSPYSPFSPFPYARPIIH